jgi:hypothetical protein
LLIAYCLLPIVIAYCLLLIAYCLLPIAYCLLPIAYCLLPIAYCFLLPHPYSLLIHDFHAPLEWKNLQSKSNSMKRYVYFFSQSVCVEHSLSQAVGIGTTTPSSSAILDIKAARRD